MRNAALVLGILGGVLAMLVGFFVYGYTVFIDWFGEVPDLARQVDDVQTARLVSFAAPILAIAGGAMAHARALVGGLLMLAASGAVYYGLGFGVFTMFPIAMCGLGGVLAIAAGRPDEAKSHF